MTDAGLLIRLSLLVVLFMLAFRTSNHQHHSLPLLRPPNVTFFPKPPNIPPILFIYTTCNLKGDAKRGKFDPSQLPGPSKELTCIPETNRFDCCEAVPMLNFIIANYETPLAHKYVFIHGHEKSWHYRQPIYTQLQKIMATSYFDTEDYGGIYGECYTPGPRPGGEQSWALPIYKYVFANTSMARDARVGTCPCCGTFFMKSSLTHTRPKSEYILIRDNLRRWSREHLHVPLGAAFRCSRVMEWTWHILFANKTNIPKAPV